MKIQDNTQPVYGNTKEVKSFKINACGNAFYLLSNGLYKNKIGAFIRELSCNAIDGHKAKEMQGVKAPKNFDVTLPTYLNPQFTIRDYGIGMDEAGIEDLFTTYFASSKTSSNEFVGAYGLGSKSPFAYTNTFSVISWFGGFKSVYSIYSDGVEPKCVKVLQTKSAECSGVQITIPIIEKDFSEVYDEAVRVYYTFNKDGYYPNITNAEDVRVQLVNYRDENTQRGHRINHVSSSSVYLVMANVAYPLPHGIVSSAQARLLKRYESPDGCVYVDIENGTMNPLPSREELQLDEQTRKTITDIIDMRLSDQIKELQDMVDECSLPKEAWNKLIDYVNLFRCGYTNEISEYFAGACNFKGTKLKELQRDKIGHILSYQEYKLYQDSSEKSLVVYNNSKFKRTTQLPNGVNDYGWGSPAHGHFYKPKLDLAIITTDGAVDDVMSKYIRELRNFGIWNHNGALFIRNDGAFKDITTKLINTITERDELNECKIFSYADLVKDTTAQYEKVKAARKQAAKEERAARRAANNEPRPVNSTGKTILIDSTSKHFLRSAEVEKLEGFYMLQFEDEVYEVRDGRRVKNTRIVNDALRTYMQLKGISKVYTFTSNLEKAAERAKGLKRLEFDKVYSTIFDELKKTINKNNVGFKYKSKLNPLNEIAKEILGVTTKEQSTKLYNLLNICSNHYSKTIMNGINNKITEISNELEKECLDRETDFKNKYPVYYSMLLTNPNMEKIVTEYIRQKIKQD